MTPEMLIQYARAMRENGVFRFRDGDLELVLGPPQEAAQPDRHRTEAPARKSLEEAIESDARAKQAFEFYDKHGVLPSGRV